MYVCTYVRPEKKMTKDLPIEFNRSRDKDRDRNKKPSQHQHHRPCMYTFPRPSTPPQKKQEEVVSWSSMPMQRAPQQKKNTAETKKTKTHRLRERERKSLVYFPFGCSRQMLCHAS